MNLSAIERQESIVRFIEKNQRISVEQVCDEFDISMATARRDLEALAEQGKIQRVHGGAIATRQAPPEQPALQRVNDQREDKERIGQLAAQLVKNGETIFLGSGTTVQEVAIHLRDRQDLTVITNSLLVVNTLANCSNISIIMLGGMLRRSELSLIGHLAEQALADIRADKVILGVRAIDATQGLMNDYIAETMTDRAILGIGREVIVVADHTKCERTSTVLLAPPSAMHVLVTDEQTSEDFVAALQAQNIRVLIA